MVIGSGSLSLPGPFSKVRYLRLFRAPIISRHCKHRSDAGFSYRFCIGAGGRGAGVQHSGLREENPISSTATRVLLIISDGEDHEQEYEDALNTLTDAQVSIYTLGIGTTAGTPFLYMKQAQVN